MIRKLSYPLAALLVLAGLLIAGPAPAFATGCHHNHVYVGDWGAPFLWTNEAGTQYWMYPSPLKFTGDSSSACHDVNVQNVSSTCGTVAGYVAQRWSPDTHNYYGIETDNYVNQVHRPVLVTQDSGSVVVIVVGFSNGEGYRLDLTLQNGCTALVDTPILD